MLYEYRCPKCKKHFDDFRRVEARQYSVCPKCGTLSNLVFRPTRADNHMKQFKPYVDEHISPDGNPLLVESRSQKKALLKQQSLEEVGGARWV